MFSFGNPGCFEGLTFTLNSPWNREITVLILTLHISLHSCVSPSSCSSLYWYYGTSASGLCCIWSQQSMFRSEWRQVRTEARLRKALHSHSCCRWRTSLRMRPRANDSPEQPRNEDLSGLDEKCNTNVGLPCSMLQMMPNYTLLAGIITGFIVVAHPLVWINYH